MSSHRTRRTSALEAPPSPLVRISSAEGTYLGELDLRTLVRCVQEGAHLMDAALRCVPGSEEQVRFVVGEAMNPHLTLAERRRAAIAPYILYECFRAAGEKDAQDSPPG